MPVNQFYGLQVDLPQLVPQLTFNSVKDYDDYIARLKKVPLAFQQITDDMSIGMDDHREPPAYLMEKVLAQKSTPSPIKNRRTARSHCRSRSFQLRFLRPSRRALKKNCSRRSPGR